MLDLMTRRDARSLDHATLEEMRRLAVQRVVAGEGQRAVSRSLQLHHCTVSKWMRALREGGEDALASTKASGPAFALSDTELRTVSRIVIGKDPRQLNFGPALWTLPLVAHLIEMRFGKVLHKSTVGRILHRLGITPQKPVRRAFARDEEECRHWMATEFPALVRRAKRRQATLLFLDETGLHEDHAVGRTWGKRGSTPVVEVTGGRRRVNIISALSPRGRLWFRCYSGTLTAARFVSFLQALLDDTSTPIELVLDRHPAHMAAATRRFVHEHRARLTVHWLPVYAPDLNPSEHIWGWLKGCFAADPLERDEDLTHAAQLSMARLQRDRRLVRAFFGKPEVAYVKAALKW